mgnify:CR=1 FL=1
MYITHNGIYKSAGIKKVQAGTGDYDDAVQIQTSQASRILGGLMARHKEKCLMKIDCEGAEYGILKDLSDNGYMKRINVIIMEWHVGKYRQLEELLKNAGFDYVLNKTVRDFGMCYMWNRNCR